MLRLRRCPFELLKYHDIDLSADLVKDLNLFKIMNLLFEIESTLNYY